ncbi:MAG TPA: hypothetical protein DCP36_00610 [Sporomusaceae bacterium]|nr:hypothetical protein [Sporomusaceae bacterium]
MITSSLLFLAMGFSVGAFGTLIGVGGGVIFVPIFLLALHWTPQYAIGTSLTIVFLNALSGSIAYIRQKKVYYDAVVRFSLATIPGALAGGYLAEYFTGTSFRIAFGLLLAFFALIMFFRSLPKQDTAEFDKDTFTYNRTAGVLLSVAIGFISSIFGIGGGFIHVPAMVYFLGFPTHIATATSHCVLAISSFFGVISHYLAHNILAEPALLIGFGAIVGAQFGARLSVKVKSRSILMLLALALLGLGLRLILVEI